MMISKSWLVVVVLVGILGTGVFSYPASRKLDLAEELLSEEADGDYQYDEVELKPDEAIKKSEVAREGSASEPARKDDVAEAKPAEAAKKEEVTLKDNSKVVDNPESDESESPASGEEDDESPKENAADVDSDTGSGSAADSIESNAEKASASEVTQDDEAEKPGDEEVDTPSDEKAADEPAASSYEADGESEGETAKKGDVSSVNEEFEEESGAKRNQVTKGSKRDYGEHGDCHHCHEHGGGCHEGCCCEHERGHHHGHHEHEDCCHHHGHHHGFVHEWGEECCGGHHEHECCGHHEHGHHHEGEHEHDCCHHHGEEEGHRCGCCNSCCCHHGGDGGDGGGGYGGNGGGGYGGNGGGYGHGGGGGGYGGNGGGYGWGRANIPVGYHCHDMVSKNGNAKTKRFCVPVYGFPEYNTRDTIARPVKKQTVHVGYGYASGDNYRLGYQQGGMGGLASSFTGQIEAGSHEGPSDHFNKRSYFTRPAKRHYEGHGFSSYNHGMMHGSATPYGHPVTHPGFTTMGYPGHALASQDVRGKIPHRIYKRDVFEEEPQLEQAQWGVV